MADSRILHKRGSHGDRIVALDHLQFRVWVQYVLSADDYGVMRASVSVLQADNPRLEREPVKRLQAAMDAIVASGLIQTFTHQGQVFWWQTDWQDFQGVRHPRQTVHPKPSPDLLTHATVRTRELFGYDAEPIRKDFRKVTEIDPPLAGAGGRETLTLPLTPPGSGSSGEESARDEGDDPVSDTPPVFSHRRSGAMARPGGLVGNHGRCAPYATEACARGKCVPPWLAQQWLQQFEDMAEGERHITAFIGRVLKRIPHGPIGDDAKQFWEAEWKAEHGTQARAMAPVAAGRGAQNVAAMQRAVQHREATKALKPGGER